MKKIILIITLITCIFWISISCKKKCESNDLGTVKFTPTDLQIVPYNGTETLIFKDSLGDSLKFELKSINLHENYLWHEYPGNPDCMGNYFYTERYYVIGSYPNENDIEITLSMDRGDPWHQNIKKIITISISYNKNGNWYFKGDFYFDASNLIVPTDMSKNSLSFVDSLKIGKKYFFSVISLKQIQDPFNNKNIQYVFYSVREGVVALRTKAGGQTWCLK